MVSSTDMFLMGVFLHFLIILNWFEVTFFKA